MALASGGGLGYVPYASGTFGSLLGVALYVALWQAGVPVAAMAVGLVLATGIAIWLAGLAEEILQDHDSGKIVLDEVVGMAIALLGFPPTVGNLVAIFVLFRVLDVIKLWPASWIDRQVPGGLGVVLDDVVSGVYANVVANVVTRFCL